MQINAKAPLGPMVKKSLVDIINDEFYSQHTIYNAKATVERAKIMDQYKKGVGYSN